MSRFQLRGFLKIAIFALATLAVVQIGYRVYSDHLASSKGRDRLGGLSPGDTLPPVRLYTPSDAGSLLRHIRNVSLQHVLAGCAVVIFFTSTCPWCERAAPGWKNVDSVGVAGRRLPVYWIGQRSDTGAVEWLDRHGFTNSFLVEDADWRAFRIFGVPQFYMLGPERVFIGGGVGRRDYVEDVGVEDMPELDLYCRQIS